jgi:hypothetical protein
VAARSGSTPVRPRAARDRLRRKCRDVAASSSSRGSRSRVLRRADGGRHALHHGRTGASRWTPPPNGR